MKIKKLFGDAIFSWNLIASIAGVVIIGNGFLAIKTISDLSAVQKGLYNTGEVIVALDNLHLVVLSAESGQRGYLLTEIEEYLTPYERALQRVTEQRDRLQNLQSDLPEQAIRINELLLLVDQKLSELKQTVGLAQADKEKQALRLVMSGTGRDLYKEIQTEFATIKSAEVQHRQALYDALSEAENEAKVTFAISGVTSILLLIGLFTVARLNTRNELSYRLELEKQNNELADKVTLRTKELTLYSDELARSNRELEDFAFVASHDLQEPLRKIRAFGDRLETSYSKSLDDTGADYVKRMRNAAERMSNLINDLLEFSRITTRGKEFIEVSLDKLLAEIIDDLEISIQESEAKLEISALPKIKADESQMHQLFLNLMSNAIKFRKTDVLPIIKIVYMEQVIENEKWHVINVEDNGIGFEQEFADKIFIPFQRLHSRTEYKGTGIGLAVCRRIVERHGGRISAVSSPGDGTVFKIELPFENILLNGNGANTNDSK
ncbi:MAG: hypothetical protein Alis3KO_39400 [Aliiglaciecola sp.]